MAIILRTYENNLLSDGTIREKAILDQYGRVFEYNSETKQHEPTGLCGHANH